MKKLLFILLFIPAIIQAQTSVNVKLGYAFLSDTRMFTGVELQGSNVSVTAEFLPVMDKDYYVKECFGLYANIYLWAYQSTPYFSTGIITHGKLQIDPMTNKQLRSMPVMVGYRFRFKELLDELSFDISGGVDIGKYKTSPYFRIGGNFTLFKSER